jgi:tetratricopeptide (TPR) repeat protein
MHLFDRSGGILSRQRPALAGAAARLGATSVDQRSEDAALKNCAFLLSFNPESDLAYAKRGDVYKVAGNIRQAAGNYKTALSKSHGRHTSNPVEKVILAAGFDGQTDGEIPQNTDAAWHAIGEPRRRQ